MEFQEVVATYEDALAEAGYVPQQGVPKRTKGQLTNSRDAFEAFAELGVAPEILATVAWYSELAGLPSADDFSVSCLPGTGWSRESMRACTVSVGIVEVAYAVVDRSSREFSRFVVYGEPDGDLPWLSDRKLWKASESGIDGGGIRVSLPGSHAAEMLSNPQGKEFVARRIRGVRERKRRVRRKDWHNPWLWEFIASGISVSPKNFLALVSSDWDVTSDDVLRLTRQRTSQQAFRDHLMNSDVQACAICGLDVPQVLEAAHLVPHAEGGRASSDNGCILCANHHRAFDAGLYKWTGHEFIWVGDGEEPALGKQR